jgi:hypothetical protein
MMLTERRKGLKSPDWHEPATRARGAILAEIERLEACRPVAARSHYTA